MSSYRFTIRPGLAAISILVSGWQPAAGATIVVHPDGTGDYPTIQAAITAANEGDEVLLSNGVFRGDGNYDIDFLGKEIAVRSSSGDPAMCVVDCEGEPGSIYLRPGFRFTSGEGPSAVLEGLTVTRGWNVFGGAARVAFSSPTIRKCIFRNNAAWQGGALSCQWSDTVIEDCVIVENAATEFPGGGVVLNEANVVLRRCTISFNAAGVDKGGDREGGGIAIWFSSTVVVENCIISHSLQGEGIYCEATSTVTVACSDIFANEAGDWIGCLTDQAGTNGNLEADPLFCDPSNGTYGLTENSPCAPKASACGLIGALGVSCRASGIVELSWGRLKALYRH